MGCKQSKVSASDLIDLFRCLPPHQKVRGMAMMERNNVQPEFTNYMLSCFHLTCTCNYNDANRDIWSWETSDAFPHLLSFVYAESWQQVYDSMMKIYGMLKQYAKEYSYVRCVISNVFYGAPLHVLWISRNHMGGRIMLYEKHFYSNGNKMHAYDISIENIRTEMNRMTVDEENQFHSLCVDHANTIVAYSKMPEGKLSEEIVLAETIEKC